MIIAQHHNEWLSLTETSGSFLSLPVLMHTAPQGLETLDRDRLTELPLAYKEWLDKPEVLQLELFTSEEKDQLNRNMDALRRRMATIPDEIEQEKKAILKRFSDPQTRMFPVDVAFLIPEKYK